MPLWVRLAAFCAVILVSWYFRDELQATLPLLGFKGTEETVAQLAISEDVAHSESKATEEVSATNDTGPVAVGAVLVRALDDLRHHMESFSEALTPPTWLRDVYSSQCCLLIIPLLFSIVFGRWWRRHKDIIERQGSQRNIGTIPGDVQQRVDASDAEVRARSRNASHARSHGTPHGDEPCGSTRSPSESFHSQPASATSLETAMEDARLERQSNNHGDSSVSAWSASTEQYDASRLRVSTSRPANVPIVQPRAKDGMSARPPSASSAWLKPPNVRLPDPRMFNCGELQPSPDSQGVFGKLLLKCKYRVPVTFDVLLEEMGIIACSKLHESCDSDVFRVCGHKGIAVIKVLHYGYMARPLDLVLTEVRISRLLRRLHNDPENRTTGFSELRDAYCVWDCYSDLMTSACVEYAKQRDSSYFTEDERYICRPYVVLCMSFAGRPLDKVKFDSAVQVRSIVQQVSLTLAVAESALQFEHRALSPHHVLVKQAYDEVAAFWIDGRPHFVDKFGVQATIIDFSTSRLLLPREESKPVFADIAKVPLKKSEDLGETFAMVYSNVSEDPSQFFPWTNMAYLAEVTGRLVREHERQFSNEDDATERQAWRDVCYWLGEMPRYTGAKEFALDLIVQSA